MLTLLAIYGIGVVLVFLLFAIPYILSDDADGLLTISIVLALIGGVMWPILIVLTIWDFILLGVRKCQ